MMRHYARTLIVTLLALVIAAPAAMSQRIVQVDPDDQEAYEYDGGTGYDSGERGRTDRYLGVEIWPNHHDGEYYEGDRITLNFRANRDAFVAIYSIDSRGRVNLLFPSGPGEDNFVQGGVTHHLPASHEDYDLVVAGPEGVENIQIIASREPFPIPEWYPVSGILAEGDDRMEFMDYLNDRYFVRYGGQRFAYDRTAIYVNEWEDYYFRPVYYPTYHPWTLAGNVYIDYPFGSSVYINGIYWGCAPLYLPRVYVGWHTITIYDHWGYCWESDIHISRYHTLVLNDDIIRTSPRVKSKYREVQIAGYRDPVRAGYPNFAEKKAAVLNSGKIRTKEVAVVRPNGERQIEKVAIAPKKHVRGSTELVKTERGIETSQIVPSRDDFDRSSKGSYGGAVERSRGDDNSGRYEKPRSTEDRLGTDRGKTSRGSSYEPERGRSGNDYYQKKSGDRKRTYRPETRPNQPQQGTVKKGDADNRSKQQAPAEQPKPSYKPSDNSGKQKGSAGAVQQKAPGSNPAPKSSGGSSSGKRSGGAGKVDKDRKGR